MPRQWAGLTLALVAWATNPGGATPVPAAVKCSGNHCACPHNTVCVDSGYANDGCKIGRAQEDEAVAGPATITGYAPSCISCRCVTSELFAAGVGLDTRPKIVILGLIKEYRMVAPGVMRWLQQMTCNRHMDVRAHVLTTRDRAVRISGGRWIQSNTWRQQHPKDKTEPMQPCHLKLHEDRLGDDHNGDGRVKRLSALRDKVREIARTEYADDPEWGSAAVVVADLDLVDLPDPLFVREAAVRVTASPGGNADKAGLDMVCSNGRDTNPAHYTYYDTFSTILSPNTFVYPLKNRKHPKIFPGEDPLFIIETPAKGQPMEEIDKLFTRDDLARMLDMSGPVVPLRSCFGGLAVYRPDAYFHPDCTYSMAGEEFNPGERYSNSFTPGLGEESAACEHVILHECIRKHRGFATALARDLKPQWTRTQIFFE